MSAHRRYLQVASQRLLVGTWFKTPHDAVMAGAVTVGQWCALLNDARLEFGTEPGEVVRELSKNDRVLGALLERAMSEGELAVHCVLDRAIITACVQKLAALESITFDSAAYKWSLTTKGDARARKLINVA